MKIEECKQTFIERKDKSTRQTNFFRSKMARRRLKADQFDQAVVEPFKCFTIMNFYSKIVL